MFTVSCLQLFFCLNTYSFIPLLWLFKLSSIDFKWFSVIEHNLLMKFSIAYIVYRKYFSRNANVNRFLINRLNN